MSCGLIFDKDVIVQNSSIEWSFGCLNKMRVRSPHRFELPNDRHSIIFYNNFLGEQVREKVNSVSWVNKIPSIGPRSYTNIIDIIPAGYESYGEVYDEGMLELSYLEVSPDISGAISSLNGNGSGLSIGFGLKEPSIRKLCNLLLKCPEEQLAEQIVSAILLGLSISVKMSETEGKKDRLAPYIMRKLQNFIYENLGSDISLAMLAELAGLSPYYFTRAFKTSFGYTPYHYVVMQRLRKAKELLLNTAISITDIAFICGFNSSSQFSVCFKNNEGITPRSLRNQAG